MTGFAVLHALRLKGVLAADALIDATALSNAAVESTLAELEIDGLVRERTAGRLTGWMLTPAGIAHSSGLVQGELDQADARSAVDGCYLDFLPLNGEVLRACSDWQVRTVDGVAVRNDHQDREHDAEVIQRLATLHTRAQPILARLAEALPRFGSYEPRFSAALNRVQSGEHDWLTSPGRDSYHTVWFELHEDLLVTLDRRRVDEREL